MDSVAAPTPGARTTDGPTCLARSGEGDVHLSVIVPVYDAGHRLVATLHALHMLLARQPYAAEVVVVDDHSGPETARVLDHLRHDLPIRLLRNRRNRGKGYSVSRGMLAARGALRVFTDADLAYPTAEIERIVDTLERGSDVAIGCRALAESRFVMSPPFSPYLFTRRVLSRSFNALVRATLVEGVLDTQAGLKGFTRAAAELIFRRLTVARFGFDVECLFLAQQHRLRVTQVPVTFRYADEPSTVRVLRDGVGMMGELAKIRVNAWRGHYA